MFPRGSDEARHRESESESVIESGVSSVFVVAALYNNIDMDIIRRGDSDDDDDNIMGGSSARSRYSFSGKCVNFSSSSSLFISYARRGLGGGRRKGEETNGDHIKSSGSRGLWWMVI